MVITLVKTKQVPQVSLKRNEKSWPKSYKCNFLEPGAVSYEDVKQGVALLKKEATDLWIQTFKGKPVIIEHQDISPETFKKKAVGYITNVWYEPTDGWWWCEFLITDDEGHEAIKDGYSVSCSFDVADVGPGGEWHSIKYDEEITVGEGLHLALVTSPRYEDCRIVVNSKRAVMNITSEWKCQECGHHFDKNAPKSGEMKCPKCKSTDIDVNTDRDQGKKKFKEGDPVVVQTGDDMGKTGKIELISGDSAKVRTVTGALFTYKLLDLDFDLGFGNSRKNDDIDRVRRFMRAQIKKNPGITQEALEAAAGAEFDWLGPNAADDIAFEVMAERGNKSNDTDLTLMSTMQLDKYLSGLSDPGLQTVIDGEHDEAIKKIAKLHITDRATKKEEELAAGAAKEKKNNLDAKTLRWVEATLSNDEASSDEELVRHFIKEGGLSEQEARSWVKERGSYLRGENSKRNIVELVTNKKEGVMWKLFAKKQDKAAIQNDKIDATKVFVKVDDEMVPLSTLMNSVGGEDFEMLQESDTIKINGKDVSIKDLVAAHKANKKNDDDDEEKKKADAKKRKDDGVCACGKKLDDDDKKRDDGLCNDCFPKKKADDKKKKDDEKEEEEEKEKADAKKKKDDEEKEIKNKANAGKNFFVDLENARHANIGNEASPRGGAFTREDKAARGKHFFGSKKKSK